MNASTRNPQRPALNGGELWIEAAAFLAAVLLIPLYMGLVHVPPSGLALYVAVGGVAMAIGEELQFGAAWDVTIHDVLLWAAAIAGGGGLAYLLALLLV